MVNLERSDAEQFSEVYKTVLPSNEYSGMVVEMSSGACIAIEVRGPDCVNRLRALCGPIDVEIAQAPVLTRFGQSTVTRGAGSTTLFTARTFLMMVSLNPSTCSSR